MNELTQLLLDPAIGLISADKLHRKYPQYSTKQIREAQKQLPTYQINTPAKKPKAFNSIYALYPGDIIQIDLMDVSYNSTANNKIKFLLTFIDVYTRYAQAYPIKNKQPRRDACKREIQRSMIRRHTM
jgi:hypothetical protein